MNETLSVSPSSPLLSHCPPSLPAHAYYDKGWFDDEQARIWGRHWSYVGRSNDLPPMTMRRLSVAGQNLILVKDRDDRLSCFHNTCRHRGAELCSVPERSLKSKLISCPYHQWSYDFSGRLVATPFVSITSDFRKQDHGLFPVHLKEWNGFVYVCVGDEAPDFADIPDFDPSALDSWPMVSLKTGHTMVKQLACNWKIFWENYNECLHCPGIHPELSEMVPIYSKGYMAANEAPDWTPDAEPQAHALKPGARTWTANGQPCGPEFPNLTDAERDEGQLFVTMLPTMFIVAHVDYVRVVSLRPLGPELTELKAEWLFPEETLSAADFDLGNVVDFASLVMLQDGDACEMNQRGLHSQKFTGGTLMPQEFEVFRFQQWIRQRMGLAAA